MRAAAAGSPGARGCRLPAQEAICRTEGTSAGGYPKGVAGKSLCSWSLGGHRVCPNHHPAGTRAETPTWDHPRQQAGAECGTASSLVAKALRSRPKPLSEPQFPSPSPGPTSRLPQPHGPFKDLLRPPASFFSRSLLLGSSRSAGSAPASPRRPRQRPRVAIGCPSRTRDMRRAGPLRKGRGEDLRVER